MDRGFFRGRLARLHGERGVGALALGLTLGCGAIYPEVTTPLRPVSNEEARYRKSVFDTAPPATEGEEGDSPTETAPPPADYYYIVFEEGFVPARTRDGREWPGGLPDSYARLEVNGRELMRTPVEYRTRTPTWPDQDKYNYKLNSDDEFIVDFYVNNMVMDRPLCHVVLPGLDHLRDGGKSQFNCDSGARVTIGVYPARPVTGLGFYYELRGADGVRITRVLPNSPAQRAGIKEGDSILQIDGKLVKGMDGLAIQSAINSRSRAGLSLDIKPKSGAIHTVEIKEGPIYLLRKDDIPLEGK